MPQPERVAALGGPAVALTAATTIVAGRAERQVATHLARTLRRATGFPMPLAAAATPAAPTVELTLAAPAGLGREGYTLTARNQRVRLAATTAEGLFRATQTLLQLLPPDVETTGRPGPWTVPQVEITDRPRFGYRGLMLDVGRRFVPAASVKRLIDQAARYKINVFHWHLTEDQGWRLPSRAFPALNRIGASTQAGWREGGPWFYTEAEYRDVVAYAAERFITVVPEIDGPGHSAAAMASVPGLNCDGVAREPYHGFDVRVSVFCLDEARLPAVRDFVDKTFAEAAALSPGPWLHIGGDEVPSVTREQYAAYVGLAGRAAVANGKRVIGWHQVGDGPLPPGSAVQYWGLTHEDRPAIGTAEETESVRLLRRAVRQGAQVIVSPADRAYLDMKYTADTPYGLRWAGLVPVERAYDWDPVRVLEPVVAEGQVLGVEAPLWTDRAYPGSHRLPDSTAVYPDPEVYLDHMVFPRLPAIAELGWSPERARDWPGFRARLAAHGPRWAARGIGFHRSPEIDWAD
ncbi:beta-N-acetylhexosaminidase [Nonomuraea sp. NPDC050310]|uniref:beta-N-acetylhexosaminidase n=1 Tax=Nonomuraea sp. NPDC050310 TaxID=3154935 RepID=UPI0033CCCB29